MSLLRHLLGLSELAMNEEQGFDFFSHGQESSLAPLSAIGELRNSLLLICLLFSWRYFMFVRLICYTSILNMDNDFIFTINKNRKRRYDIEEGSGCEIADAPVPCR